MSNVYDSTDRNFKIRICPHDYLSAILEGYLTAGLKDEFCICQYATVDNQVPAPSPAYKLVTPTAINSINTATIFFTITLLFLG